LSRRSRGRSRIRVRVRWEMRLITERGARHAAQTIPRRNRLSGSQAPLLSRVTEGRQQNSSLGVLVPWWFKSGSASICVICGFLSRAGSSQATTVGARRRG
jgi:hypothetical protein